MAESYKDRLERGFPVFSEALSRSTPLFRQALVDGGAAGAIAVADIKAGDQIVGVMHDTTGAILADLTSEFVANADAGWLVRTDGYIDNTGGTATTGDKLLVTWIAWAV